MIGGIPVKAVPLAPLIDNTTVTIYGSIDVSGDIFNPSVFDQGTKLGIASNISSFGIRARHNLAPYGWDGMAVVTSWNRKSTSRRLPTSVRRSAPATASWGWRPRGARSRPANPIRPTREPPVRWIRSPGRWAITIRSWATPAATTAPIGLAHEPCDLVRVPIWNGFQFSALASPGQNYAKDNSDFSYGDTFQCNGTSARGSGSDFPGTGGAGTGNIGGHNCTDGTFGNAYNAALTYKNGPFTTIAAYELHENVNRRGDDILSTIFILPILLADGSTVLTGVHNEWAAKVGGGYRFNDGLGDLQLNAYYEWIRREVSAAEQPFNERSRDAVFASATQYIGKWALSASYAHAFKSPGNPAMLSVNDPVLAPAATIQANLFSNDASQYAIGARYNFNSWASSYVVGSVLKNGTGAHYCLGASGHGYQVCSRDASNDTIGGATIKAATTGMTFNF